MKETSIANCEILDEKYQGIFSVGIIIKAGGLKGNRLVVCLRFL